jgi:protein Tex
VSVASKLLFPLQIHLSRPGKLTVPFGAFVDVGVHQDGLVHISAMANAYVKDPRKIAKPGDVVGVKVLEVDPKRRRISLTMRLDQASEARSTTTRAEIGTAGSAKRLRPGETLVGATNPRSASGDAMAEAFRRAGLTNKRPGRQ